jgi:dipeptidyl-peptidase 4
MKHFFFAFLLLSLIAPVHAQQPIDLDDCFTRYIFYADGGPDFRFMADGQHYSSEQERNIVQYDLRMQRPDSILMKAESAGVAYDNYSFSADEQLILLQSGTEPVYRHSVLANYHVYNRRTRTTVPVNEGGKAQYAALSPDGKKVAFVQGNNVFIRDLSDQNLTQVTTDGLPNQVINGLPDWVNEEEFSPVSGDGFPALVWNPDGQRIAFLRYDESNVPEMTLFWQQNEQYPSSTRFKFPKVGQPNARMELLIYDLPTRQVVKPDPITAAESDYIVRLRWVSKFNLVATVLNRYQDQMSVMLLTPSGLGKNLSFTPELLLEERDSAYVDLNLHDHLHFLDTKQQFTWMSERSGYTHLYLYDFVSGNLLRALTTGNFDVTDLYGVDEKNGTFYYQTATPTPMDRQVWEGYLNGASPRLITPGTGTYNADFSPSFDYYTLSWSDANTPPRASLYERGGREVTLFTDNTEVAKARRDAGLVEKTFFQCPAADGTTLLNGWMMRPRNQRPDSLVQYPVFFDVYGGPGSQTVLNQYDGFTGTWHQMLVQLGYIVVSVDNRGTGARGRDFKKCTQLQLGRYETEDQIAAARYLAQQSYVNPDRIGIFGWSFGGYLSTSCILKGADVFKAAIAVAPVTNWKWYDTAYTERYMHGVTDNLEGYEGNAPINFAERLKGGNYLLCHGMADDNVHYQHSAELINALIKYGKQFETYYYPNRNHSISGDNATRHLFTKLTTFVTNKL